ncbi:MGDG synthase family glycosyltransferase [Clostridium ganghwense]|uniref:Glycosyltransferase n=1 Tax=Clostridium ganghwense TaxID=312089 RepID=A0ABT4CQY9_9CLOT|nr:glycosyltransferase [Clostridium ganghwense]MCY6371483.1 glycosyltransferase [Clostridium ganghwense]
MNILILTGKFGMGHYSVANTLKQDIEDRYIDTNVSVHDIFECITPKYYNAIYDAYTVMINKASSIYNACYKFTYNNKKSNLVFENYFINKIEKLIDDTNADMVISTLPFCSQIISAYKKNGGRDLPLITCITDVGAHQEWINFNTDAYIVPSNSTKMELISKGVPSDIIYIGGIPVKKQFRKFTRNNRMKQNQKEKRLLIMGGGLGIIQLKDEFMERINQLNNVKTTIITGNNTKLYNELLNKYENIEVIGYTDEVYKYMGQADLIISKAGGVTLFETISAELPIVVIRPFLGQEINNAYFVENKRIGEIIWDKSANIPERIESLINDELKLKSMSLNMKSLKESFICDITKDIIDKFFANNVIHEVL